MKYFIFLIVMFLALPVCAQETLPPECRLLKEHKPSADVTYQAGVDVRGRPVVPADVNAAPMGLESQTLVVPLSVDLAKRLQGNSIQGLDMTGTLGFIEIEPGGRVLYNGQDLTGQVHVLCGRRPQGTAVSPDGQAAPDIVESAPVKKITPPAPETPVLKVPETPAPEAAPEPVQGALIEGSDYR